MTVCMQVDFHAIVEAQKVHSLYSHAGDGPEDRKAHGLNLNWKKGENGIRCPRSYTEVGRKGLSMASPVLWSLQTFHSLMPTPVRKGNLYYEVFRFKCQSHLEMPFQTYPGKLFQLVIL